MAKTKQQQQQQQQQLLVIYLTICLVVVSLLMKVDSVSASSAPLDGSGNMLPPQIDNDVQEHNSIMDQAKHNPTVIATKNPNIFEDNGDDILKEKSLSEDIIRKQLNFGHSIVKRAPAGFMGMRGKKMYNDDDNNTENDDIYSYNLPWKQLQNSDDAEDINWDEYEYDKSNVRRYKKAPTAFYGVRGKKFVTMNGGNSNNNNHRWHDFLQNLEEERVRDAILQDFVERLAGAKDDLTSDMTKRAPTGFTGVRGKRPALDELDSSMESLNKRGLGNNAFVGVRGKKDVSHQAFKRSPAAEDQAKHNPTVIATKNPNIFEDNGDDILKEKSLSEDIIRKQLNFGHSIVKRAPAGFMGMRGKKMYNDDDNNTENDDIYSYNLPWKQLQNSDDAEDINWDEYEYDKSNVRRYKKAPTAFYGVRGKKFVTMNGGNSNNNNHRWHDFLQNLEEERVRDAILQDFVERLAGAKDDLTSDMTKRAPTGFTGVRGKRPALDELDSSMESLNKRGLGNNAFVGVRGKKDVSHQAFKRSPAAERYFFGFWKKSSPGRNRKRQRFVDFNNKFVAVRGKKSSFSDVPELNGLNNNESPLTAVSLFNGKRTPKGFLGMRGKRPFATEDSFNYSIHLVKRHLTFFIAAAAASSMQGIEEKSLQNITEQSKSEIILSL